MGNKYLTSYVNTVTSKSIDNAQIWHNSLKQYIYISFYTFILHKYSNSIESFSIEFLVCAIADDEVPKFCYSYHYIRSCILYIYTDQSRTFINDKK